MLALFNLGGGGIFFLLVVLPILLFWLWTLVDAIQNKGLDCAEKICWVLAIIFLQIVGSVLYYFFGHPKQMRPRSDA